jgi:hypothetical protein
MLLQPDNMAVPCCLIATAVADSLKKQPSVAVVRPSSRSSEKQELQKQGK